MASLLGNLRVRLTAETEDFRRGLDNARKNLDTFQKSLEKFSRSTIAQVASFGALVAGVRASIDAAKEYESANSALAASARLAGQDLDSLKGLVADARAKFGLSATAASEFALQISRLADKTGGLKDPSRVLEAFLNIGAARGMSAAESLNALTQAVKLSDDGIAALLNRKPDDLFNKFAASVSLTADKLSEQGKAQALVNQVLADGENARGEFQKWLATTEGMQWRISQGMTDASTVIGEAFQPALAALVPVMKLVASAVAEIGVGITALIADFQELPALAKAASQAMAGDFTTALATVQAAEAQWRKTVDAAKAMATQTPGGSAGPLSGRGTGGLQKDNPDAAKQAAGSRQDAYMNDAMAKARAQEQLAVEALGPNANVEDKLQLELDLNRRIYEIKRQAAQEDVRLSESGKATAILRAKLEKETADFLARGHADNEKNQQASEAQLKALKDKAKTIADAVSGTVGTLLSGGHLSGAQLGQNIGSVVGSYVPVLGSFAAGIGGFLGGLFDKKKKEDAVTAQPVVKSLEAIERAQKETITTIKAQTNALLNPESRLIGLPSDFVLPKYNPTSGPAIGGRLDINVTVDGSADRELQDAIAERVSAVIGKQLPNMMGAVLNGQRTTQRW